MARLSLADQLIEDLQRAAEILEEEADVLRASYTTPDGKWPPGEDNEKARDDYTEYRAIAARFRAAAT